MITKTHRDEIIDYQKDASNYKGICDEVIVPENKDELITAIKTAYSNNTPITLSGARTGLGGGCVPLEGIVISTERINNILHIDYQNELAIVRPGLLRGDLEEELEHNGYFLPPNPTEKNSSIGGNVNTNASGSRTFKYGAIRKYVESLSVVLANGDEIHLHRGENFAKDSVLKIKSLSNEEYSVPVPSYRLPNVKHAAGYYNADKLDAIDLFIGSEGTLGIVSDIVLKIEKKPESVFGAIIFFDNYDSLFKFVDEARERSRKYFSTPVEELNDISARLIEFYDDQSLNLLRESYPQIPDNALSAIWIEQEHTSENEDVLLNGWYDLIRYHTSLADDTWMAMTEKEHREFREFRHLLPLIVIETLAKNDKKKFGTDIAVPDVHLKDFFWFLKKEIKKSGLMNAVWGHIGNSHFHANVMARTEEEMEKAYGFFDNTMAEAVRLNGTVSGEHGIGKIKKKYLLQMFGKKAIDEMKEIKLALDPKNLLGKGNLFDI
jgi:D-lactate dehydrogenase (cytochrome)